MALGITFIPEGGGSPARVRFAKLGIECKMATPCSEELAQQTRAMVANIVAQIGKGPTLGIPSEGHQERKRKNPGLLRLRRKNQQIRW